MENNFLITYLKDGKAQYAWLESEEEVQAFIDGGELEKVFGAIEVTGCRELDVEHKVD